MTSTAVRLARAAVVVVLAVLLSASPATAAGTGGIEVTPYPGLVDGKQVTAFHTKVPSRGDVNVRYSLRNTTSSPRSARLYAASATPDGKGGFTIGAAGSSPYLRFPTRTVTLAAQETQLASFQAYGQVEGTVYGAIVVEVSNGSVTQRAATLVYLTRGRTVPLPLLVVLIAVGLLLLTAGGVAVVRRSTRNRAGRSPERVEPGVDPIG